MRSCFRYLRRILTVWRYVLHLDLPDAERVPYQCLPDRRQQDMSDHPSISLASEVHGEPGNTLVKWVHHLLGLQHTFT